MSQKSLRVQVFRAASNHLWYWRALTDTEEVVARSMVGKTEMRDAAAEFYRIFEAFRGTVNFEQVGGEVVE